MTYIRVLLGLLFILFISACSVPFGTEQGVADSHARALSTSTVTGAGVQVKFQVENDWGSGYTASVTIVNTQSIAINGWDLEWGTSGTFDVPSYWNAGFVIGSGSIKATSVANTQYIAAGSSINFGYNVNGSTTKAAPTWVKYKGVLISGTSTATSAPSIVTLRPVDKYGQLKVVSGHITDKNGTMVQLRGVSSHGLQWFPFVDNNTVKNLVTTFNIDVLRAAMYVKEWDAAKGIWAGYLGSNPEVKQEVIEVVQDAIDEGIYVIVDWHIHWNPPNSANPHWTGDPYTADAVKFFRDMGLLTYKGKALKDYPNIIWEVMNEPGQDISWSQVKTHANQVIQQIRTGNNDPDNLILVPATNWAQALDTVAWDTANDRPDRITGNVLYTLHFYASSHGEEVRSRAQTAINNGLAIFADEWGAGDYTGNGVTNYAAAQTWVDWMNTNKISWSTWNVSDKNESTALLAPGVGLTGPWTQTQLSTTGKWVQNWIVQGR